jgi:hypothetical protein
MFYIQLNLSEPSSAFSGHLPYDKTYLLVVVGLDLSTVGLCRVTEHVEQGPFSPVHTLYHLFSKDILHRRLRKTSPANFKNLKAVLDNLENLV